MIHLPELFMEWQYWQHVAKFPHVNVVHVDSLHDVAGDLRYLITSSYSYCKDMFYADNLVEQTISLSTKIPFSHEKLVIMLDLVEGIKSGIHFGLLISSLNHILASTKSNWVSSNNVIVIGRIFSLLINGLFSLMALCQHKSLFRLVSFPSCLFGLLSLNVSNREDPLHII